MDAQPTRHARTPACAGLGYVETLACIAISALLLTLAIPSLRRLIERQRVAGVRTELLQAIQWARWEALRRSTTVTLQRRTDCEPAPSAEDQWHCGWHMVAGDDVERSVQAAEAEVLQSFSVPQGLRLVHPGGGALLQFTRAGFPTLVAHKFIIGLPGSDRDAVDPALATTLCMNRTGRVRQVLGQTTC